MGDVEQKAMQEQHKTTMHIKCIDEDVEHGEFSLEVTETTDE